MAISPVGAANFVSGLNNLAGLDATSGATGASKTAGTDNVSGQGFGDMIAKAIDNVQSTQANADSLATKAATGDLTDVHDYMIAATQAQVTTELTVAVRNKAVEAFNDIMRMQI